MRYSEDFKSRFTARHRVCISLSGDVTDKLVLNVGCWIGWYEKFMVEKGCKFIVGVDVDLEALRKAKKNIPKTNVDFMCASALKLPFRSHVFDIISMFDALEHFPNGTELNVLSDVHRSLQVGGVLLLSTPNDTIITKILDPAYFLRNHRNYSPSVLKETMEKSGFAIYEMSCGGGLVELLSVILLYVFKHIFDMEIPFKTSIERLRSKEYQRKGFATLFVKALERE